MPLLNSSYLRNVAERNSYIYESRVYSSRTNTDKFDIFLSHSFLDREVVKGLYHELTSYGYSVYVDWIVDPQLDRNNVTKASAELIRKRLKASKTLIAAISSNAELSKWMPWELGYVDGQTNKCALIPVSNERYSVTAFHRREYLLLYPFIKKVPNRAGDEKLWVIDGAYTYSLLESWFSSGTLEENRDANIEIL